MKAEKICKHDPGTVWRKDYKRYAHREFRRAVKRDPENAPTKLKHVTMGWSL